MARNYSTRTETAARNAANDLTAVADAIDAGTSVKLVAGARGPRILAGTRDCAAPVGFSADILSRIVDGTANRLHRAALALALRRAAAAL